MHTCKKFRDVEGLGDLSPNNFVVRSKCYLCMKATCTPIELIIAKMQTEISHEQELLNGQELKVKLHRVGTC